MASCEAKCKTRNKSGRVEGVTGNGDSEFQSVRCSVYSRMHHALFARPASLSGQLLLLLMLFAPV